MSFQYRSSGANTSEVRRGGGLRLRVPAIRYWALAMLILAVFGRPACAQSDAAAPAERLDQEWAQIFYDEHGPETIGRLTDLHRRAESLVAAYPGRAEPLIVAAISLCGLAGVDWGLDSLSRVERARQLLTRAIDLDPRAMEGAAYITLGNLYWRMPGWPISFGDDRRARQYLTNAVRLYPDAIDTNFFMADFLIDHDEDQQARPFLERAERAPLRDNSKISDTNLKREIAAARRALEDKAHGRAGFFARLVPAFGAP